MGFILFRLIPYLYAFIKEMNRLDIETGTNKKKNARFRTYLAITISLFLVFLVVAGYEYVKLNQIIEQHELQDSYERSHGAKTSTDYVSRDAYEKLNREMTHRMSHVLFVNELLADQLREMCDTYPTDCDRSTLKVLKDAQRIANLYELKEEGALPSVQPRFPVPLKPQVQ